MVLDRLGPTYDIDWYRAAWTNTGAQEEALLAVFDDLVARGIQSVLDVGCNKGRMGYLLKLAGFKGSYVGVDKDGAILAVARQTWPRRYQFAHSAINTYRGEPADLVVGTEILMHVSPRRVRAAIDNMAAHAHGYLVTCDWAVPLPDGTPIDPTNWCHPYDALYAKRPDGLELRNVLPAGPLQKVYVLGR